MNESDVSGGGSGMPVFASAQRVVSFIIICVHFRCRGRRVLRIVDFI